MLRAEIDLNVRTSMNWTFVGFEDVDGPISEAAEVEVYESESGITGRGRIARIDYLRRIAYLEVDWGSLRLP
jgi:hypothetical protein